MNEPYYDINGNYIEPFTGVAYGYGYYSTSPDGVRSSISFGQDTGSYPEPAPVVLEDDTGTDTGTDAGDDTGGSINIQVGGADFVPAFNTYITGDGTALVTDRPGDAYLITPLDSSISPYIGSEAQGLPVADENQDYLSLFSQPEPPPVQETTDPFDFPPYFAAGGTQYIEPWTANPSGGFTITDMATGRKQLKYYANDPELPVADQDQGQFGTFVRPDPVALAPPDDDDFDPNITPLGSGRDISGLTQGYLDLVGRTYDLDNPNYQVYDPNFGVTDFYDPSSFMAPQTPYYTTITDPVEGTIYVKVEPQAGGGYVFTPESGTQAGLGYLVGPGNELPAFVSRDLPSANQPANGVSQPAPAPAPTPAYVPPTPADYLSRVEAAPVSANVGGIGSLSGAYSALTQNPFIRERLGFADLEDRAVRQGIKDYQIATTPTHQITSTEQIRPRDIYGFSEEQLGFDPVQYSPDPNVSGSNILLTATGDPLDQIGDISFRPYERLDPTDVSASDFKPEVISNLLDPIDYFSGNI